MTYNFFADKIDKIEILEYIFKETDLKIFDHSSDFDEPISEYKSVEEITSKFDLTNGDKFAFTFNLWSPKFKGNVFFEKILLNSKYCEGHTFRYSTRGWGLIQLYFGGIKNNELNQSHIGHFNEKGALQWEDSNSINGLVNNWDWKEINKASRKLKYQIHSKMAIRKIGSFGVLREADKLEKQGTSFR
jgi:hypothetical protein